MWAEKFFQERPETFFYLPARLAQFQSSSRQVQTVYIGFRGMPPWPHTEKPRIWLLERNEPCRDWIIHLSRLFVDGPRQWSLVAEPLLQACLNRLGDLIRFSEDQPSCPHIATITRQIEAWEGQNLNVTSLAKKCGMSASHLRLTMRRHLGVNPLTHYHRLKMDQARRLLRDPYLRIHEVAAFCGFEGTNYFCRLFRKYAGVSPTVWRRTQSTNRHRL